MRSLLVVVALLLLPSGVALGSQESSLRCERGIVAIGDAKIDLLGKCGEPALREEWGTGGWTSLRAGAAAIARGTVVRERWTYDFGPTRFVMYAVLEGGKVVGFERGSYGYDASRSGGAVAVRRARCAPEAFHVGDTTYDVLSRCGEPASADAREEPRAVELANGWFESRIVVVEVWAYDFGPRTFTRLLEFENGKLVKIDAGTWGYSQ